MQEIKLPPEGKRLVDMSTEELSNVVQMAWEIEDEYGKKMDPINVECDDVSVSELCKVRRMTAILQLKLCLMYGVPIGVEHTRFLFELPEKLLEPDKESRDSYYLWESAFDFMLDIHSFADFSDIGGFSCEYIDIDEIRGVAELCLERGLMDDDDVLLNVNSDDAVLVPHLAEAMRDYFDYPDSILKLFTEAYLYMERSNVITISEILVVSSPDVPKVISVVNGRKDVSGSEEAVLYDRCVKALKRSSRYIYQATPEAEVSNGKWFAANLTQMEYLESGEFEQGLSLSLSNRITAAVAGVLAERILALAEEEPKQRRNFVKRELIS